MESCPQCGAKYPQFDGWDCKKCKFALPEKARKAWPKIERIPERLRKALTKKKK